MIKSIVVSLCPALVLVSGLVSCGQKNDGFIADARLIEKPNVYHSRGQTRTPYDKETNEVVTTSDAFEFQESAENLARLTILEKSSCTNVTTNKTYSSQVLRTMTQRFYFFEALPKEFLTNSSDTDSWVCAMQFRVSDGDGNQQHFGFTHKFADSQDPVGVVLNRNQEALRWNEKDNNGSTKTNEIYQNDLVNYNVTSQGSESVGLLCDGFESKMQMHVPTMLLNLLSSLPKKGNAVSNCRMMAYDQTGSAIGITPKFKYHIAPVSLDVTVRWIGTEKFGTSPKIPLWNIDIINKQNYEGYVSIPYRDPQATGVVMLKGNVSSQEPQAEATNLLLPVKLEDAPGNMHTNTVFAKLMYFNINGESVEFPATNLLYVRPGDHWRIQLYVMLPNQCYGMASSGVDIRPLDFSPSSALMPQQLTDSNLEQIAQPLVSRDAWPSATFGGGLRIPRTVNCPRKF